MEQRVLFNRRRKRIWCFRNKDIINKSNLRSEYEKIKFNSCV